MAAANQRVGEYYRLELRGRACEFVIELIVRLLHTGRAGGGEAALRFSICAGDDATPTLNALETVAGYLEMQRSEGGPRAPKPEGSTC